MQQSEESSTQNTRLDPTQLQECLLGNGLHVQDTFCSPVSGDLQYFSTLLVPSQPELISTTVIAGIAGAGQWSECSG